MKKKNLYNVCFSLLSQIVIIVMGLIIPRLILTNYGSDTNGLTSTVTQIFTYLALLEAGIGQATKNALYPYIQGDEINKDKASEVMTVSQRYYRKITYIYSLAVVALAIVLPLLLKSNLSFGTIFGVVIFEGATGIVSFYFVESYNMLLAADGKNYVVTNIEIVNKTLCYGLKIVLAVFGVNIVFIQLGFFFVSLIKLLLYKWYMNKHYGWVDYKTSQLNHKLKDRNAYIITEIAWTIFSSTDMIVLSVFCSTQMASVYSVYNMVFVAINSLLNSVYSSLVFNLGQTFHEDRNRYIKMHDLFNSFFLSAVTILMGVTYLLILPFVKIYTNGVEDINYFYPFLPLLFCLVQILSWSRFVSGNLSGVAGYAKKVSYISMIEAIINISLSLILVRKYSIYGVLISTVIALPLKVIYLNCLADKVILKRSMKKTCTIIGTNWICFALLLPVKHYFSLPVKDYSSFAMYGVVCLIVLSFFVFFLNCCINKDMRILFRTYLLHKK